MSVGLAVFSAYAFAGTQSEEPPPIPPGFKDDMDVMTAIRTGKVETFSRFMHVAIPDGVEEVRDVEYGRVGSRALVLDLYRPKGEAQPVPGLIFIHGGGWEDGSKDDLKHYAVRFAGKGYVTACIGYRLSQEAPFPACVQDAQCAVRWMRAYAGKYGIAEDRIGLVGASAGAHIAMLAAYVGNDGAFEESGGHSGVSQAVQAVVDLYGPTDFAALQDRSDRPLIVDFFGGRRFEEAPELYAQASPVEYLDASDPPTLVLHGAIDSLVPIEQADTLVGKLKALGVDVSYDRLDGYPHEMDRIKAVFERCVWSMARFFAQCLGESSRSSEEK